MANKEDKIVVLTLILLVFLFLVISKTLNSGFHFVDDHEVINIKSELTSSTLIDVTEKWVKEDIKNNIRFRPLYIINRVFETWLLGSDFFLWSLLNGVLCCLAMISFYSGMRNLKFGVGESIAFLIITFIGPQTAVWWRLGPGESMAMVFLGLAFYFMSISPGSRTYHLNSLFFVFFLILTSLTKESFLIIVPAMIILKIWIDYTYFRSGLKNAVYKNLLLLLPLTVVCIELYFIKYYVGIGYSGLDTKFTDNVSSILLTSLVFAKSYLRLLEVVIILLIISWFVFKMKIGSIFFPVVFFLLIVIPNIILYARSGLVERYLLPASFGLGFLVISIVKSFDDNPGWFKKLSLTLIIFSFLPFMITVYSDAIQFSKEGYSTKKLLTAISTNYVVGTQVMVIVDPVELYEKSVSLKTYLFVEKKIDLYGYLIVKDEDNPDNHRYIDGWKSYFNGKEYENLRSKPRLLIFLDNKMVDEFFEKSKLLRNNYLIVEIGNSPFALFKENDL